ncbi:MAG: ATP-binding cassette domain-containing protein [Spirochaetes bacterium]|nr:ATP-binding cassette domain-containing protein [Brevinematales bacterium]MCL1959080.1 ATP-binding cassette domain-containing protein [Spirochaetota bacterium]
MNVQAEKIQVQNLSKQYGNVQAVTDVSFSVSDQQVVGFLGPNGAGKTTIMKILTGFHFPSSGTALVDGIPVTEQPLEVKKRIGYLPENVPLYGDLTVDEYLAFAAEARFIPKKQRKAAIEKSLEACAITSYRGRKIETLSKGYRQRAGLAQAILHDPPILILDEPTTGLDPNQIIEIRSLIKELGKRKTVILSTHILQEVEAICTQVLIINNGRIAAQGRPEAIAASMKGGDNWELILKGADADYVKQKIPDLGQISSLEVETSGSEFVNARFFIQMDENQSSAGEKIFDWAVSKNLKILEMNRKKISIEDIFVKLTGDETGSTGAL